jgi:Asp-tRNA(Asn)/Glu-tRNA(Gln) amidotransferase A subunit family amidase
MVALFELGAKRAADAVRNGEQTAEALAEALLARCAAASPLNAFIRLEADRLRAAARAADQRRQRGERLGPLHGVPLALKDNIDTADFPTTGGTPALAAHRPKRNAPIVQHLLDAGAIVLGKTKPQWEFPRLCRGGSKSLTYPAVDTVGPSTKLRIVSSQAHEEEFHRWMTMKV